MASLWFSLGVILYIISEIIAVPLRIMPQENEYSRLNQNLENGLSEEETPNIRVRRDANSLPAGCENGNVFGLAKVPQCHVANAKYNEDHKLCLVELLHVPGMPDGVKGYHYIALNHFLYKFSNATIRTDIVRCPTTTPNPATKNSATQPQTTPATGPNVAGLPDTSQSNAKTVINTGLYTNAPGNTPSTATKVVNKV